MADRECKRCFLYEMADKAGYESVKNYLDSIDPSEKVPDDLYEKRLAMCRDCEFFLSAMCRKCGCYVEVRAALKKSECPALFWRAY